MKKIISLDQLGTPNHCNSFNHISCLMHPRRVVCQKLFFLLVVPGEQVYGKGIINILVITGRLNRISQDDEFYLVNDCASSGGDYYLEMKYFATIRLVNFINNLVPHWRRNGDSHG